MRVLIFEGIATSGKSSVIRELTAAIEDQRVSVVGEEETHFPIKYDAAEDQAEFFIELIQRKLRGKTDLVIFDRLYLTQAFRSRNNISVYQKVENLLLPYSPITIFLQVNEDTIAERVMRASEHRDAYWKDYIQSKGQTFEQIGRYYAEQQKSQLELLKNSTIPYRIFDTTDQDYHSIANILKVLV